MPGGVVAGPDQVGGVAQLEAHQVDHARDRRRPASVHAEHVDAATPTEQAPAQCAEADLTAHQASRRPPPDPLWPALSTCATSSRVNSTGNGAPRASISLTFVPESTRCSSGPWGQVFAVAIWP